jgi:F-type H+-transporting ATPase subunit b
MELNITLLGQLITFAVFVAFTMKFVWPPITKAMQERKQKIADGLASAQRGKHELELAQHKATEIMRDAKVQAANIVDEAHKRSNVIVDEAKQTARQESERIIALGQAEIQREVQKAKAKLKHEVVGLSIAGAERVLRKQVDEAANRELIDQLINEME